MFDKYSQEEYDAIELGIRERVNAATKGPWIVGHSNTYGENTIWIENLLSNEIASDIENINDATFIAYARTDINRLLAHIDILEKRNREYVHVILDLTMQIARTELEQEEER